MRKEYSVWRCTPLHWLACITVVCLAALNQPAVNADPAANQSSEQRASSPSASNSATNKNTAANVASDRHLSRGERLARTALAYRGVPYRWGGTSPRGFDCSGLVQTVCAKWGIYLPRVAHEQYKQGTWVKPDQLQPGDLVFFKDTYRRGLSHVGIYVGEGYFIHAPGTGKHVCLARLDGSYHKKHWAGAKRLDLTKLPPAPDEDKEAIRVVLEDANSNEAPAPPLPTTLNNSKPNR